jgi:hypothetical protein
MKYAKLQYIIPIIPTITNVPESIFFLLLRSPIIGIMGIIMMNSKENIYFNQWKPLMNLIEKIGFTAKFTFIFLIFVFFNPYITPLPFKSLPLFPV